MLQVYNQKGGLFYHDFVFFNKNLQIRLCFKKMFVSLHSHLKDADIFAQSLSESPPRKSKGHLQFLLGAL